MPLITHELSHNLRVIERKERNYILQTFIFNQAAQYVVAHLLSHNGYFEHSFEQDDLFLLLWESLSQLLYDNFRSRFSELVPEQNIGALLSTIRPFLTEQLGCFCEQPNHNINQISKKDVQKALSQLLGLLDPQRRAAIVLQQPLSPSTKNFAAPYIACAQRALEALQEQVREELAWNKNGSSISFPPFELPISCYTKLPLQFEAELIQRFENMKAWHPVPFSTGQAFKEMWDLRWKDYYTRFKSAYTLFNTIRQYDNYGRDKEADTKAGYTFLKQWFDKCQSELDPKSEMENRDRNRDILLQSFLPNNCLNQLGFYQSDVAIFQRRVAQTLQTIQRDTFYHIADDSTSAYREVFADLGMCAFCNFDAFGYLRFFSRQHAISLTSANYDQATKTTYHPNADMSAQRLQIVCQVLFPPDKPSANAANLLLERSIQYLRSAKEPLSKVLKDQLGNDATVQVLCASIYEWIEALVTKLQAHHKDELELLQPSLLLETGSSHEEQKKLLEALRCFFPEFEHLYEFAKQVMLIWIIAEQNSDNAVQPLIKHFRDLFESLKDRVSNVYGSDEIRSIICNFYNTPEFQTEQSILDEEFQHTLRFVEKYYYLNWITYADSPSFITDFTKDIEDTFKKNRKIANEWIATLIKQQEKK